MNVFSVIALAMALSACASLQPHKAPGCKGPLRPANPYGSVLLLDGPVAPGPAAAPAGPGAGECGSPS
jgi:hypothetical protein